MVIIPTATPKDLEEKRKEICNNCEKNKIGICTKCGCVIKFKVKFEQNQCPLGKW